MSTTTGPVSTTYHGEAVQEPGAEGVLAPVKAGVPAPRAIGTTNVSSAFWAMDNTFRARGTVARNFRFSAPVIVNAASQVAVTVCERDGNGNPFIGDAEMEVLNVAPRNDGSVDVRWRVTWNDLLPVRLNFLILN